MTEQHDMDKWRAKSEAWSKKREAEKVVAGDPDLEGHFSAAVEIFGLSVESVFQFGPVDPVEALIIMSRAIGAAMFAAVETHADKERAVEAHHIMLAQFLEAYDVSMAAKGRDLRMSKTIERLWRQAAPDAPQ